MLKNASAPRSSSDRRGSGSSFDLDSARYQRIVLMTDADVGRRAHQMPAATLFNRIAAHARRGAGLRGGSAAATGSAE